MISDSLLYQISQGRNGENWGYSMGLPRLEEYIGGVMKSIYTLIFSASGVGKTTLALYSYIYRPLMENIDNDNFHVTYFSLEMSAELLLAKLLCIYIYEQYGIELSTNDLLSRHRGKKLSDEDYKIVEECIPWLKKVEEHVTIFVDKLDFVTFCGKVNDELKKLGKFDQKDNQIIYTPNNEKIIHEVVIDHLSLVRAKNGRSKKEEMDMISSELVMYRNICKISPVVIMQANRDSTSTDRRKLGFNNMQLSDTKDSGSPTEDAEIIISLMNPYREKLASYAGYDIKILESNFRVVSVLKNRFGQADVEVGCAFYGKIGMFAELPRPDQIYDYEKYLTPDWIEEKELEDLPKKEDAYDFNKNLEFTL